MSLRVLHLLAPARFGGVETVVRHLARAQVQGGMDVHLAAVVAPRAGNHPFVEAARTDGLQVHPIEVPGRGYGLERRRVDRLLSELGPQVVHTHGYRPDILDAPLARGVGIATVTTAHGFTGNDLKNRFYEWVQRRAFRDFDAVLAVSAGLVRRVVESGVPRTRVHLVPNACLRLDALESHGEARRALGVPTSGPPLVGWVGRIGPEKGPDLAIRALADPLLDGAHLCMVGEGRAVDACETLAAELWVNDRVRWTGPVSEAGRLMAAFDVLCLSSRTEGTPMVLFEADQAGVPVVATAVGGVPQVLGDGWNLVSPDDPHLLAVALARALGDTDAVTEARERARRRIAAEFNPSQWAARHVEIYHGLVSDHPARAPARRSGS